MSSVNSVCSKNQAEHVTGTSASKSHQEPQSLQIDAYPLGFLQGLHIAERFTRSLSLGPEVGEEGPGNVIGYGNIITFKQM